MNNFGDWLVLVVDYLGITNKQTNKSINQSVKQTSQSNHHDLIDNIYKPATYFQVNISMLPLRKDLGLSLKFILHYFDNS